jgi:hypothetical protein
MWILNLSGLKIYILYICTYIYSLYMYIYIYIIKKRLRFWKLLYHGNRQGWGGLRTLPGVSEVQGAKDDDDDDDNVWQIITHLNCRRVIKISSLIKQVNNTASVCVLQFCDARAGGWQQHQALPREGRGTNLTFKNFLRWSLAANFLEVVFKLEPSIIASNSVDPLSNTYPNSGTP